MNCTRLRNELTRSEAFAGGPASNPSHPVAAHLSRCVACRAFAARMQNVRLGLRAYHAGLQPDEGFAGRVRQRLSVDTPEVLGRTALRLLPLSAAFLLLLLWLAARTAPAAAPAATLSATEDAYVTWILTADEGNS